MRRGMEAISLWHCWGVMEAQVALIAAFSSSALLGLVSRIFLFTIPHIFSMGLGQASLLANQAQCLKPGTGGFWSTDSSCSPLLVNLPQILEWPLFHNPLKAAVIPVACAPFYIFCLDTALCEQPASLAMTFCVIPSLCRLSMIVFWTTVKSTVFPMIVQPTEPNWETV